MMRSLFSGVSGLKNHQTRMDVIGNNISNVNTTGFKSSRVTFSDTLNQTMTGASAPNGTIGGTNPKQVGLGSAVSSIDLLFTDGSVQSTGKNTDLCLSGNGLFVVSNGSQTYYTRNGAFEFDAVGNYTMPGSGLLVQGWTAVDGTINTADAVGDIVVPAGKSMAAKATNIATYNNNLNSAALEIKKISGGYNEVVASEENTVTLTIAGKTYTAKSGTFSVSESYKLNADAAAGATTLKIIGSSTGATEQDVELTEAIETDISANAAVTSITGGEEVAYVEATEEYPSTITDGTKSYEVTKIMNGTDAATLASNVKYTLGAVAKDDTTITLTGDDNSTLTLTLSSAAEEAYAGGNKVTYSGGSTTSPAAASKNSTMNLLMSDGSKVTQTSGTYTKGYSLPVTTTLTIYDTLGNVHSLPVYFTKTKVDSNTGNQWTVSLNTNGSGMTTLSESDGSTTTVTMKDTVIQFTTEGKYSTGSGTATLTLTNGSTGTQQVTLDLSNLTQFAGNNTVNGSTDGNAAGTLESIAIDASGIITGTYTNGVRQSEAQVAVAQFTNASGLTKTGSSLYQESNNSGTPNVKTVADLGVKITASALEMSNVDIANEFADMIITQRGFQSNSKIITVGDEMLETVINMKR